MPRQTRSSASSEGEGLDLHSATNCLNPPPAGGASEVSYVPPGATAEGGADPRDPIGYGPSSGSGTMGNIIFPRISLNLREISPYGKSLYPN